MGVLFLALQEATRAVASSSTESNLVNVLLSAGVAGACLIGAVLWIRIKDQAYERRIDQMLADKDRFITQYIEMNNKYQTAMDKFASTLDMVVEVVKAKAAQEK